MTLERRAFLAGATALGVAGSAQAEAQTAAMQMVAMYGTIGKMTARAGQRDALVAILMKAIPGMPGCLSYIVANDPADPNAIWITEVWETKEAHGRSLSRPAVRAAIAKARPLIAGMQTGTETVPIGGWGLKTAG